MEICLGMDEEPTESLWVRIKEKTGKGDIVVSICYRLPDQEEWMRPLDSKKQPHVHRPWYSQSY